MDLANIEVDLGKEGWIKEIPEMDDLELHVAAWENTAFKKKRTAMVRARPRREREQGLPEMVLDQIHAICIAETILKDWKNVRLKGIEQPYSKELALKFLTNPAYPDFRDACIWAAKKVAKANAEAEEGALGNSAGSSPGGGNGETTRSS